MDIIEQELKRTSVEVNDKTTQIGLNLKLSEVDTAIIGTIQKVTIVVKKRPESFENSRIAKFGRKSNDDFFASGVCPQHFIHSQLLS